MASLRASKEGIKKIKEALSGCGYPHHTPDETLQYLQETISALGTNGYLSRGVWDRFCGCKPIRDTTFEQICQVLGKESEEIAEPELTNEPTIEPEYFVGRNKDLEELEDWIVNVHCRLIILYGLPGMGKRTLVTKLIAKIKNTQNTRLVFDRFSEDEPVDILLRSLVNSLSLGKSNDNEISRQRLWHFLEERRCLVVLQCEPLASYAALYRQKYKELFQYLTNLQLESHHKSCILIVTNNKLEEVETGVTDDSVKSMELKELDDKHREELLGRILGTFSDRVTEDREFITELAVKIKHTYLLKFTAGNIINHYDGNIQKYLAKQKGELYLPKELERYLNRCLDDLDDNCWAIIRALVDTERMTKDSIEDYCYEYIQSHNIFMEAFKYMQRQSLLCSYRYDVSSDYEYGLEEIIKPLIYKHSKFKS